MASRVTKTMANKTLAAITASFKGWVEPGYGPKLMEDWDGHDFCIIWEEGAPYGWVHMLHGGVDEEYGFKVPAAKIPAGVWCEAVNSCVVALFRD